MPFAVFRRHQRKLLAIFAILAMFGFVLADSLPRLLSGGYNNAGANPVIVELYGKSIRRGDLGEMIAQRTRANLFMAELRGFPGSPFFGDVSTASIVDALILEHEADILGMPDGPEVAREWLKQRTGGLMSRELFEATLARFNNQVSGEQILRDIANQVRIGNVRQLLGSPIVTPLDVFQAYRDQTERIWARAVAFPVADYLAQVPEPTAQQVQAYYDRSKDVLPDPARDTPGFKVPRQVRVEVLSIDGKALALALKDKLTEAELRSYYENRKSNFALPSELPVNLFLGDPEATPALIQPFADVRPYLATSLADEKALNEIVNRFNKIKDDVMIPFADSYLLALDEIAEAKKRRGTPPVAPPKPQSLKPVADQEGLTHEITPLLTREQAEHYGQVSSAEVGLTRLSGGRQFAAEFFDPKTNLFEPVELTDFEGRRYLARKIEDLAPRVPPLDEIRSEVILAWKSEQARSLAEKAAHDFAARVQKRGGTIEADIAKGQRLIDLESLTKLQPGFPIPGQMFQTGPPTATEIPQIPSAGAAIRDALFQLTPRAPAVAANQPKTIYYVLSLVRHEPASFSALFAPNGDYIRYQREALTEAIQRRDEQWMSLLRAKAGLKPGWKPRDESDREASRQG